MKNRGIQKGTTAYDEMSRSIDKHVRDLRDELQNSFPNLTMKKKLLKEEIPYGKGACSPDGGLWFKEGKLVAAFEAKKQGDKGNAIDRWYKNFYVCQKINPEISYVTFAIGEGASNVICETLNIAHEGIFDQYRKGKASCFLCDEGFTIEQIRDIMQTVLKDCSE